MKKLRLLSILAFYLLLLHNGVRAMPSEHSAAHVFRVVHEMIEGWQAEHPERFHRVCYAELCEDPRGVLHDVADFCGLSWSAAFEATRKLEGQSPVNGRREPGRGAGRWRAADILAS